MKLDNHELHDLLVEKDINYLYHANTVATSISFIEAGGLVSRGGIENLSLYQTSQMSDELDKKFDVWNDVFLDTTDLHGFFPRQNLYGPALFKISISFLLENKHNIWITKDNPKYWNDRLKMSEKYFSSVDELREDWEKYEQQRKMITIKNELNPILFDYLKRVIVDNPKVMLDGINLFDKAKEALINAIGKNKSLRKKFMTRPKCGYCYCTDNYLNSISAEDLKRLFFTKKFQNPE